MYKRVLGIVMCAIVVSTTGGCKSDTAPTTPAPVAGSPAPGAAGASGATAGASAPAATAGAAAPAGGTATAGTMAVVNNAGKECAQITTDPTLSQSNCNNVADKCFLLEHAADVRTLGGQCATQMGFMVEQTRVAACLQYVARPTDPAATKCFTDCLDAAFKAKFMASVSPACLICPNAVAVCSTSMEPTPSNAAATACVTQCLTAPNSAECTNCLCAQHPNGLAMGKPGSCLIDAYADCTGFRPTPDQVSCPAGSM